MPFTGKMPSFAYLGLSGDRGFIYFDENLQLWAIIRNRYQAFLTSGKKTD